MRIDIAATRAAMSLAPTSGADGWRRSPARCRAARGCGQSM